MKFLQLKCTTVFAEDTNVFVQEQISSKLVNLKLSKVHRWLIINKLSLNVKKHDIYD